MNKTILAISEQNKKVYMDIFKNITTIRGYQLFNFILKFNSNIIVEYTIFENLQFSAFYKEMRPTIPALQPVFRKGRTSPGDFFNILEHFIQQTKHGHLSVLVQVYKGVPIIDTIRIAINKRFKYNPNNPNKYEKTP